MFSVGESLAYETICLRGQSGLYTLGSPYNIGVLGGFFGDKKCVWMVYLQDDIWLTSC